MRSVLSTAITRRSLLAGASMGLMMSGSGSLDSEGPSKPLPLLSQSKLDAIESAVNGASIHLRTNELISSLTLEQKVAQLFVLRPEDMLGYGTAIEFGDDLRAAILDRCVGGFMLSDANFIDPDQTRRLTGGIQESSREACGLPMLIAADEEGGTVVRVCDKPAFGLEDPGNMRWVGEWGDVDYAESEGYRIGSYLRDVGVNVDFAPDADITYDESSFVYWRSFGGDPELAADMVGAMVRGFNGAGTLCTPKHFPGIGNAQGDSHVESIYLDTPREVLRENELQPFYAAIGAGTQMIMVGHLVCTAIDAWAPASMSYAVVTGLLRKEMGYDGVVITDSLGMAAVHERYPQEDIGVQALRAGCDMLLTPADWYTVYDGIMAALAEGKLSEKRIDQSVTRIIRAKLWLG